MIRCNPDPQLVERVRSRIAITSSGCWEWEGARNSAGYGSIRYQGRHYYVHRVMCGAAHGTLADGVQVDHLCRNPSCCNPEHLEPVSPRENTARGFAPGAVAVRTNLCHRGHDLTEAYVRLDGTGRQCRACRNERDRRRWAEARA